MSGGGDMNPLYVSEEPVPNYRTWILSAMSSIMLLRLATNRQLPVMGICRGHQINIVTCGWFF